MVGSAEPVKVQIPAFGKVNLQESTENLYADVFQAEDLGSHLRFKLTTIEPDGQFSLVFSRPVEIDVGYLDEQLEDKN